MNRRSLLFLTGLSLGIPNILECCEFINPLLCKDLCPQKFALRIPELLMLDVRMRVLGIRKVMKWLIFPSENVVNPCYARDTRIHNTQARY
jgi:hypothetical protein